MEVLLADETLDAETSVKRAATLLKNIPFLPPP